MWSAVTCATPSGSFAPAGWACFITPIATEILPPFTMGRIPTCAAGALEWSPRISAAPPGLRDVVTPVADATGLEAFGFMTPHASMMLTTSEPEGFPAGGRARNERHHRSAALHDVYPEGMAAVSAFPFSIRVTWQSECHERANLKFKSTRAVHEARSSS